MAGERDVKKDADTAVQDMAAGQGKHDLSVAAQDLLKEKSQASGTDFDRYKAQIDMNVAGAHLKGLPSADQLLAMATEANKPLDQRLADDGAKDLKVGEKKNPDGSSVKYEKGPDGKVHPGMVTHVDGSATKYTYDKNGRITDTFDEVPDGKGGFKEARHYHSDDGMTWMKQSGDGPPMMNGTLDVKADGTHVFKEAHGFTVTQGADGSNVTTTPKGDVVAKHSVYKDGSSVDQTIQLDGKLHTAKIHHPNGNETNYGYRADGKVSDIVEIGPGANGQPDVLKAYHTNDGHQYLRVKGGPNDPEIIAGDLQVTDDGKHVFKIAGSPYTAVINRDGSAQLLDQNGQPLQAPPPPKH